MNLTDLFRTRNHHVATVQSHSPSKTAVFRKCLLETSAPNATRAKELADSAFDGLRPRIDAANGFLASAKKRLNKGSLTKAAYAAEVAPLDIAVSLNGALTRMCKEAKALDDTRPLLKVAMAAAVLSGMLDNSALMREGTYDETDSVMFNSLIRQRMSDALSLYKGVSNTLEDAPGVLGVILPKQPAMAPETKRIVVVK